MDKKNAFTLVELMVAMTLLTVFGLMLVRLLKSTLEAWHLTESQQSLWDEANQVVHLLKEDLSAMHLSNDPRNEVRLVLDHDRLGRQRIRFVRRLDEKADPLLREGGKLPASEGYDEYYEGRIESKKLRASGGLAEVVYFMSPQENGMELRRGIRAPIGGEGSFFQAKNMDNWAWAKGKCEIVSSRILYFGVRCWGPETLSWKEDGKSYATWDSISLQAELTPKGPLRFLHSFPLKIQLHWILRGEHCPTAFLAAAVDSKQTVIPIRFARNFPVVPALHGNVARIGDEWISFSACREERIEDTQRGIMGSKASSHPEDSIVHWGISYTVTSAN